MLYPNGTRVRPHVSSPYGPRDPRVGVSGWHNGADLTGFRTIRAVASGRVTFAGWMNNAAGNTIVIDHGNGVTSVYMHNEDHYVSRGDHVAEGAPIALMGETGNASGPCNHLEIRVRSKSVEPVGYIAARLTKTGASAGADIPNPHPASLSREDEDMDFINIAGKEGSHRAGLFGIYRGNKDGVLYARRLTFDALNPKVPTLDNESLENMKKAVAFIDLV